MSWFKSFILANLCLFVCMIPVMAGGGEDCSTATVITELPFMDKGFTVGTLDDYDEICLYDSPGSGDVVYSYTPTADGAVTISLCDGTEPGYHTKLYVYENECGPYQGGTHYACNDDACSSQYADCTLWSALMCMPVTALNTYYIVVDGDSGSEGAYAINVDVCQYTGACCLPDGSCELLTEAECMAYGGTYMGDNTECGEIVGYSVEEGACDWECILYSGNTAKSATNQDDGGDVVDIGFTFNFYGDDHTEIGISANGYLTFGTDLGNPDNVPIPNPLDPNDLITPLWDDYKPQYRGFVKYLTVGTEPYRRFIAEWIFMMEDDPPYGPPPTGRNTFEAILHETTNLIEFRYWRFDPPYEPGDYTIGIENQSGTAGVNIDESGVEAGNCFLFRPEFAPDVCEGATLPLDIKPGSCPNPVNSRSQGKVPVALLGTMDVDIMTVDMYSLEISRADGVGGSATPIAAKLKYDDVATPFDGQLCDCHTEHGDGYTDLKMMFHTPELTEALELETVPSHSLLELVLTGTFLDGTPFMAGDCIKVLNGGGPGDMN